MSDPAAVRKQLKIKSGAVQRLFKEITLYRKEIDQLEKKRAKLVEDGAEEWDIKNAIKMKDESNRMVADTTIRLDKAADDLEAVVTSAKGILPADDDELPKAEQLLKDVRVKD